MLTLISKHPERIGSLVVKKLTASQQANSTLPHDTVLLQIQYDYEGPAAKRHIIFVIDTSSSMEKKDIEALEAIEAAQETSETKAVIGKMNRQPSSKISRIQAVKKAIFDIALSCEEKRINNSYSIISFNKEAEILLDGGDIYDVNTKRHNIKTGVGTSIYHGLLKVTALKSFHKMPVADTVIILLSDGYSTLLSEGGKLQEITSQKQLNNIASALGGTPVFDRKLFDAKAIIERLTSTDRECSKIFSIGMGIGYHHEYLEELSSATQAALTHITRYRDFTQMIDSEILDASIRVATLAIQDLSEKAYKQKEDQEIVLFLGKDKKTLVKMDKKTVMALFKNGYVQVKFDHTSPKTIEVDNKQIDAIDKNITLSFYEIKKSILLLNGNISINLLWDIPHTDNFCNDDECNQARLNLLKTIEIFERKKAAWTLPILAKASYISQGYVKSSVINSLEEDPVYDCVIGLTTMKKPTGVLALDEESGRVHAQYNYDKDALCKLVGLDPSVHTRADLSAKFSRQFIPDPVTRLRLLVPVRDFSREQEMEESAAKKRPLADPLASSMAALATDFSEPGSGRPVPLTATTQVVPTDWPHHAPDNS